MTRKNRQPSPAPSNPAPALPAVDLTFHRNTVLRVVLLVCVVCEISFVVLDYHVNSARLTDISSVRNFFNTTREDGLPSWFAITQTTLIALTVWMIFISVLNQDRSRWVRIGWLILAIFFSYMAMQTKFKLQIVKSFH